jgi:serine acetyltransferase
MKKSSPKRQFRDRLAADYRVNAGLSLDRFRAVVLLTEYRMEEAVYEWHSARNGPISGALWRATRVSGSVFQWVWANSNIPGSVSIGPGLRLPHPQNIIMATGSRLGSGCTVYHNTTVASNNRRPGIPRARIGDDVIVGVGVIVMGDVEIGASTILAAGSTIAKSVPPGSLVTSALPVVRPRSDLAPRENTSSSPAN